MQGVIDYLITFATALFNMIKAVALWTLDGIVWLLSHVLFLIFDGILTCISVFFSLLDFSNFIAGYAMSWAGIPDQMIWFINAVSIPAGVTMICGAIGIRMAINLIPSWATRL
jgi:hypothetical protein